jgi:hypothetical protein
MIDVEFCSYLATHSASQAAKYLRALLRGAFERGKALIPVAFLAREKKPSKTVLDGGLRNNGKQEHWYLTTAKAECQWRRMRARFRNGRKGW